MIAHLKVKGLKVKLIFNKNIIELRDDVEYIKEAVDIITILYIKQKCDCKNNMPVYFKVSLN